MDCIVETKVMRNAMFRFWSPPNLKKFRPGLLILTPGSNDDGRRMVDWGEFQKFSIAEKIPMIGCYFQDKDPSAIEGYADAKVESGAALLWAIREFADRSKFELESLPLLLWGHSAGGQFDYEMNAAFPERVGAFVVNKGGIYYTALCPERARRNPGLFFIGKKDAKWRQDIVRGLVAVNLRGGAPWQLIEENCAHEVNESLPLGLSFFSKFVKEMEHQ